MGTRPPVTRRYPLETLAKALNVAPNDWTELAPIKARLEAEYSIASDPERYYHFVTRGLDDLAALVSEVERLEAELNKALTTHRQLLDQLETL